MGNTQGGTLKKKKNYKEYTVMLVGKIGAGKSSLGNFLLKRECFEAADDLASVTAENMAACSNLHDDLSIKVIDTPGFGDFRSHEKIKEDLANALYESIDGVDAFLFVINGSERIGRELVGQFEMFQRFMSHEHFFNYVIPVFTRVDQRLSNRKEKDVHSYEKQERLIHEELKNKQLQPFKENVLEKAKQNWMVISSTCRNDDFYYDVIIKKLIQTIEGIRIKSQGMVCTANIMKKAEEIGEEERARLEKDREGEIRRIIVGIILQMIMQDITGEEFTDMFGDDDTSSKEGATGTADDVSK